MKLQDFCILYKSFPPYELLCKNLSFIYILNSIQNIRVIFFPMSSFHFKSNSWERGGGGGVQKGNDRTCNLGFHDNFKLFLFLAHCLNLFCCIMCIIVCSGILANFNLVVSYFAFHSCTGEAFGNTA
ncbi:hypothetical protein B566_EDAN004190 [Ephemera danica]|nr:hypothetical protein B566_EDAN004190 [Ephemera danica]